MAEQKTLWVNLDPNKVDLRPLIGQCEANGWRCVTKDVGTNQTQSIALAKDADIIVSIGERWDAAALCALRGQGKIIIRYGAGLDNVDVPAATEAGIPVANLPGMNSPAVAEVALLHMLNLGRHFAHTVQGIRSGTWPSSIPGNELDGKTVGLLGFGNIARQLTRMLSGFCVKVITYDAFLNDAGRAFAAEHHVTLAQSAEELYQTADLLSLHIPMTEANRGIIDAKVFSVMKPGAYLVNTCRGGVIAEDDLLAALRSGKLRGAGLDVLCEEPPRPDHPLLHMEQVFVTSHIGALAVEAEERSQHLIADIAEKFLTGSVHANIVNPQVLQN